MRQAAWGQRLAHSVRHMVRTWLGLNMRAVLAAQMNPLLALKISQMPSHVRTASQPNRSFRIILRTALLLLGVLVVLSVSLQISFSLSPFWSTALLNALVWLLTVVVDVGVLRSAAPDVVRDRVSGRWDLMRATAMTPEDMVFAMQASAVKRMWGYVLAVIVVAVFAAFLSGLAASRMDTQAWDDRAGGGAGLAYGVNLFLALLAPVWRVWAVGAVGVMAGVSERSDGGAMAMGLAVLVGLYVLRAVFSALIWMAEGSFFTAFGFDDAGLWAVLYVGFIWLFYMSVRRIATWEAVWRMARGV